MKVWEQLERIGVCALAVEWAKANPEKTARELWEQCEWPEWLIWVLIKKSEEEEEQWPFASAVFLVICDIIERYTLQCFIESKYKIEAVTTKEALEVIRTSIHRGSCEDISFPSFPYPLYALEVIDLVWAVTGVGNKNYYTVEADASRSIIHVRNTILASPSNSKSKEDLSKELCDYIRSNVSVPL